MQSCLNQAWNQLIIWSETGLRTGPSSVNQVWNQFNIESSLKYLKTVKESDFRPEAAESPTLFQKTSWNLKLLDTRLYFLLLVWRSGGGINEVLTNIEERESVCLPFCMQIAPPQ